MWAVPNVFYIHITNLYVYQIPVYFISKKNNYTRFLCLSIENYYLLFIESLLLFLYVSNQRNFIH